jgi:hypothetical protein
VCGDQNDPDQGIEGEDYENREKVVKSKTKTKVAA